MLYHLPIESSSKNVWSYAGAGSGWIVCGWSFWIAWVHDPDAACGVFQC